MLLLWTVLFCFIAVQPSLTSTAGYQFLVYFPYQEEGKNHLTHISLSNTEYVAKIHVYTPTSDHVRSRSHSRVSYDMKKFGYIEHPVKLKFPTPRIAHGYYWPIIVKSNKPVKVFAVKVNVLDNSARVLSILPKRSHYKEYYMAMTVGDPAFMVFSSFQNTRVTIRFPIYTKTIDMYCRGAGWAKRCYKAPFAMTTSMPMFSVWFDRYKNQQLRFQYARVNSIHPILVLSGNIKCRQSDINNAFCLSNMKATATWGKEYFVPTWYGVDKFKSTLVLIAHSKKWPLEITIYEKATEKRVTIKGYLESYYHGRFMQPIVVTADVPFGLYSTMPLNTGKNNYDSNILNLIPSEQWQIGSLYTKSGFEKYCDALSFLITLRTRSYIKGKEWTLVTTVDSWNYYYKYIDMTEMPTNKACFIASMNQSILYVRGSRPDNASKFTFAHDYHMGNIYDPNCQETRSKDGDGIDNDCDGFIDEELRDRQDNDDDGEVDEDLARYFNFQDSELWSDKPLPFDPQTTNDGVGGSISGDENKTTSGNESDTNSHYDSNVVYEKAAASTGDEEDHDTPTIQILDVIFLCLASLVLSCALVVWFWKYYEKESPEEQQQEPLQDEQVEADEAARGAEEIYAEDEISVRSHSV